MTTRGYKFFLAKSHEKNRNCLFYPSAKGRRRLKPIVRAMNFRGASAGDVQKFTAPPKQAVCWFSGVGGSSKIFSDQNFCRFFFFRRRKMKCRESSETRFPKVSCQTEPSSGGKRIFKVCKNFETNSVFGVEKWNVGNRLKRVLAKFEPDRSHVWGVNGRSKFAKIIRNLRNPSFVGRYWTLICRK